MGFSAFDHYRAVVLSAQGLAASVAPEEQSGDYEAGLAVIRDDAGRVERWRVRTARVTPTKAGAFVAVWRRAADGGTEPFPADEDLSAGTGHAARATGLLVFVEDGGRRGVFRFTAEHLRELGITSSAQRAGKRGFRVYPSWCAELNRQAQRTQAAQARAFQILSPDDTR